MILAIVGYTIWSIYYSSLQPGVGFKLGKLWIDDSNSHLNKEAETSSAMSGLHAIIVEISDMDKQEIVDCTSVRKWFHVSMAIFILILLFTSNN